MSGHVETLADWDLQVDDEGHRDYTLRWKVVTNVSDGPAHALYAAGMPIPGAILNLGNCYDAWAYYNRKGSARLINANASGRYWLCETGFTTKPMARQTPSERNDPLSEPWKKRGSTNKVQEEVRTDKDGNAILNSAKEPITGLMRTLSRPTIEIEGNVAWLNVNYLTSLVGAVNSKTFWGYPARQVMLADFSWEKVLAIGSYFYYTIRFVFEIDRRGWDLPILDQGNMVLIPGTNPPKFRKALTVFEEPTKVLLDNAGNATVAPTMLDPTPKVPFEYDFTGVGFPSTPL